MGLWYLSLIGLLVVLQVSGSPGGGGTCYAPSDQLGHDCVSSESVTGSPGFTVTYTVSTEGINDSLVCCKGYNPSVGYYQRIGCGQNAVVSRTVNWGDNSGTPTIKCKGNPKEATVTWSH